MTGTEQIAREARNEVLRKRGKYESAENEGDAKVRQTGGGGDVNAREMRQIQK